MTDATATTPAKKPIFELKAEQFIFPQRVQGQTIYVHMNPYLTQELKDLLTARAVRMAAAEDDATDIRDGGKSETIQFFWKHFISLSGPGVMNKDGNCGTPDQHKNFIINNSRFGIEAAAVLEGYGGIRAKDPTEGALNLLEIERTVKVFTDMFDEKLQKIVRYEIVFNMRQETEKDNRDHDTARGNLRVHGRKRESQRVVNYDSIEILFDSLVTSLDGATIQGEPCTAANKEEWIDHIPFWFKDFVLQEFFRGAQAKNAY